MSARNPAQPGGPRLALYMDLRNKSLTPSEIREILMEVAGIRKEDEDAFFEHLYTFRDYALFGFATRDTGVAFDMIERGVEFLYDKKSGIWFMDMYGHHQIVMHSLYCLHTFRTDYTDPSDGADSYIEECYGFFESGATQSAMLKMGAEYSLAPEMKTFFTRLGYRILRV